MQSISLLGSLVFSLGAHSASDVQTPEMPPDIQSICVAEDIRDRVVIIVQGTKTRESQYGDLTMCNRGEMILETKVSTGRPQRDGGVWTPEGTFEIGHMTRFRRSRTYDNSPMPLAMHLYKGIYIHEWKVWPKNYSHGCIRVPHDIAETFYDYVWGLKKQGEKVEVIIHDTKPRS